MANSIPCITNATAPLGSTFLLSSSLFTGNKEEDYKRARLAIRYILHTNTVIPIPGLHTVEEVDNAAKAVMERRQLDVKERAEMRSLNREMMAGLPAHYEWLRNWEYV